MRNNLSPESAPWGREVDTRLSSVESTLRIVQQDTTNAFSGLNAQVDVLNGLIGATSRTVTFVSSAENKTFVSERVYTPLSLDIDIPTDIKYKSALVTANVRFDVRTSQSGVHPNLQGNIGFYSDNATRPNTWGQPESAYAPMLTLPPISNRFLQSGFTAISTYQNLGVESEKIRVSWTCLVDDGGTPYTLSGLNNFQLRVSVTFLLQ